MTIVVSPLTVFGCDFPRRAWRRVEECKHILRVSFLACLFEVDQLYTWKLL